MDASHYNFFLSVFECPISRAITWWTRRTIIKLAKKLHNEPFKYCLAFWSNAFHSRPKQSYHMSITEGAILQHVSHFICWLVLYLISTWWRQKNLLWILTLSCLPIDWGRCRLLNVEIESGCSVLLYANLHCLYMTGLVGGVMCKINAWDLVNWLFFVSFFDKMWHFWRAFDLGLYVIADEVIATLLSYVVSPQVQEYHRAWAALLIVSLHFFWMNSWMVMRFGTFSYKC